MSFTPVVKNSGNEGNPPNKYFPNVVTTGQVNSIITPSNTQQGPQGYTETSTVDDLQGTVSPPPNRNLVFDSQGSQGSQGSQASPTLVSTDTPEVYDYKLHPGTEPGTGKGKALFQEKNLSPLLQEDIGTGRGTQLSPQDETLLSLDDTTENKAALIKKYIKIDQKLDTFFFEIVDGKFEYLLFLILYKALNIFGFYRDPKQKQPTTEVDANDSMDTAVANSNNDDDSSNAMGTVNVNRDATDDNSRKSFEEGLVGGAQPDLNDEKFKSIQLIKLFKELNHDFKGVGKTLDDMLEIREFCFEYIEDNAEKPGEDLDTLYESMMNGTADEWNFYTSILEYYCEELGKFNDLTMIRYKSRTDKESGNKDYIIRDINSYPSGEDSYSKLFVQDDFLYRFQDNGTTNGLLSKLVDGNPNLDNYIKVIQNAPSLIDPATVYPINMAKFYPVHVQGDHDRFSEFQKCQDLNNPNDNENDNQNDSEPRINQGKEIIQNIMKSGIKKFFSYFGVEDIEITYVGFVVFQDRRPIDNNPIQIKNYRDWLSKLNDSRNAAENRNCPFFYQGIRIHIQEEHLELHVGDIAIPNIASLINSKYYLSENRRTVSITIDDPETIDSWNRVVKFAEFIRKKSTHTNNNYKNDKESKFLRFIIISMKSFGDSFQVYYSTAIQQQKWGYSEISEKTYLSSSDKNTGAEKMLYDSPFLLNGCGIRPYQGLQNRFPDFFNVELTGNELNDNGDVGSKHYTTQYEYGSSKALLTNIKSAGKDYKRYVQILCNQIVGIVDNIFPNNLASSAINSVTENNEMEVNNASKQHQTNIDDSLRELFGEDFLTMIVNNQETRDDQREERTPPKFLINFENIRKGCLDPVELITHIEPAEEHTFIDKASASADVVSTFLAQDNAVDVNAVVVNDNMEVNNTRSKSLAPIDSSGSDRRVRLKTSVEVQVEEISKKLEQMYNSLKIYEETNTALKNKIDTFLNDFDLQEKYLTKLIGLKRTATTEELDKLLQKLNKDPAGIHLETDLNKLVANATGIQNETVSQPNTFTQRITDFISTIKSKVIEKKDKLKIFIEKMKTSVPKRMSKRTVDPAADIKKGFYVLMDLLTKKTNNSSSVHGGKNRTIKNRHAYMKKHTRKHGFSSNKRKTRHASQEKRKHKTQRKYM